MPDGIAAVKPVGSQPREGRARPGRSSARDAAKAQNQIATRHTPGQDYLAGRLSGGGIETGGTQQAIDIGRLDFISRERG